LGSELLRKTREQAERESDAFGGEYSQQMERLNNRRSLKAELS
jgi:hypothetical protein